MIYTHSYNSPLGRIIVASHEDALIGLWFERQKFFGTTLCEASVEKKNAVLSEALGHSLSAKSVATTVGNTVWRHHYLRPIGPYLPHFGARHWRSSRAKSHIADCALSPRHCFRWFAHRLRWRYRQKKGTVGYGTESDRIEKKKSSPQRTALLL